MKNIPNTVLYDMQEILHLNGLIIDTIKEDKTEKRDMRINSYSERIDKITRRYLSA